MIVKEVVAAVLVAAALSLIVAGVATISTTAGLVAAGCAVLLWTWLVVDLDKKGDR